MSQSMKARKKFLILCVGHLFSMAILFLQKNCYRLTPEIKTTSVNIS